MHWKDADNSCSEGHTFDVDSKGPCGTELTCREQCCGNSTTELNEPWLLAQTRNSALAYLAHAGKTCVDWRMDGGHCDARAGLMFNDQWKGVCGQYDTCARAGICCVPQTCIGWGEKNPNRNKCSRNRIFTPEQQNPCGDDSTCRERCCRGTDENYLSSLQLTQHTLAHSPF